MKGNLSETDTGAAVMLRDHHIRFFPHVRVRDQVVT